MGDEFGIQISKTDITKIDGLDELIVVDHKQKINMTKCKQIGTYNSFFLQNNIEDDHEYDYYVCNKNEQDTDHEVYIRTKTSGNGEFIYFTKKSVLTINKMVEVDRPYMNRLIEDKIKKNESVMFKYGKNTFKMLKRGSSNKITNVPIAIAIVLLEQLDLVDKAIQYKVIPEEITLPNGNKIPFYMFVGLYFIDNSRKKISLVDMYKKLYDGYQIKQIISGFEEKLVDVRRAITSDDADIKHHYKNYLNGIYESLLGTIMDTKEFIETALNIIHAYYGIESYHNRTELKFPNELTTHLVMDKKNIIDILKKIFKENYKGDEIADINITYLHSILTEKSIKFEYLTDDKNHSVKLYYSDDEFVEINNTTLYYAIVYPDDHYFVQRRNL